MERTQIPKRRVFISYRHEGGIETARLVYDQLRKRGYQVFMDKEGLGAVRYDRALLDQIYQCDVFVLIMSQNCLKFRGAEDWVLRELSYAFQCGRTVIPLMKDGAVFPKKLPAEIAELPLRQGIPISFEYFEESMDRLDQFIAGAEIAPRPVPQPPYPVTKKRTKLLPVLAAAVVLIWVIVRLLDGCSADPLPTEPSDDPTGTSQIQETQTQLEPSEPEPTAPAVAGNTVTNLCNGGFVALNSEDDMSYLTHSQSRWMNYFPKAERWYYYNTTNRNIAVGWKEDDKAYSASLMKDVRCTYLYVTSQWLYCVLVENETGTLYRAPNDLENRSIGELEVVAEDILYENQVAILGDSCYYWVQGDALYRRGMDGSGDLRLHPQTGADMRGWDIFGATEDYVYFRVAHAGLYAVPTDGGDTRRVLDTSDSGGRITHALEYEGRLYCILQHEKEDGSGVLNRIWSCDMDGGDLRLLYEHDNQEQTIRMVNAANHYLYLKMWESGGEVMYRLSTDYRLDTDGGELIHVWTYSP